MRENVKRRKIPTIAKVRRDILESFGNCFGRVYTWGMKQLFSKRLSRKYLKAKKLSGLHKDKKGEGNVT